MSDPGGNFLSRWSRRKESVRREEQSQPPAEAGAGAEQVTEVEAHSTGTGNGSETTPVQPLPRLEDVTSESSLSEFLRADVPEVLRRAAMRRAWSLDPTIRDFASPAEYDWNFNAAGSMAGFGPAASGNAAETLLAAARSIPSQPEALASPVRLSSPPPEPPAVPAKLDSESAVEQTTPPLELGKAPSIRRPEAPQPAASEAEPGRANPDAATADRAATQGLKPRHGGARPR